MAYPNIHIVLVKALLDAGRYCADPANDPDFKEILARREYVGTPEKYICLGNPNPLLNHLSDNLRQYARPMFFG
ncbi:MAG: ABC transporter substrate-binding protein [Leptolyngbya sp. SIO1D8]|nr:ABC transporter substrate-binding protein [Leptolyngbya sp. SIO1D8]